MTDLYKMFCIVITLCLQAYTSQGQWNGKCPLSTPKEYTNPSYQILQQRDRVYSSTSVPCLDRSSNNRWIVRPDRDGVASNTGKKLGYMQSYYVVDERADAVRLVSKDESYDEGFFVKEPEDYGWVGKSKLLLWNEALLDSAGKFRIKVLATQTVKSLRESTPQELDGKKLRFYKSPSRQSEVTGSTGTFRFYYLFDEENGFYLLGTRNALGTEVDASQYILGWVSKSQVARWSSRQVLEPNWDSNAISERRNSVKLGVFESSGNASGFVRDKGLAGKMIWDDNYAEKLWSPYIERLPIFAYDSVKDIYKIGVVGKIQNENDRNREVLTKEELARIRESAGLQDKRTRNINIVFVIDGTKSMGPYIAATKEALKQVSSAVQDGENSYRFGLVVYRDNSEAGGKCHPFDGTEELLDYNSLMQTFETIKACHEKDADKEEALFEGFYKGLALFNGHNNENNVIIIVGDTGGKDLGKYKSNIADLLAMHQVSVIAIQSHAESLASSTPYDLFIDQMQSLLMEHAQRVRNALNDRWKGSDLIPSGKIAFKEFHNTLHQLNDDSPVHGSINFALSFNPDRRPGDVQKEIVSQIRSIEGAANNLLKRAREFLDRVEDSTEENTIDDIRLVGFLQKANIPEDKVRKIIEGRYRFLLEGYTTIKPSFLNYPLYSFSLFVDQNELDRLVYDLGSVMCKECTFERKVLFAQNSFRTLIKEHFGFKEVPAYMEDESLSKLIGRIFGIRSSNSILRRYTIKSLGAITRKELTELEILFEKKITALGKVHPESPYGFYNSGVGFYWIPQNMLP